MRVPVLSEIHGDSNSRSIPDHLLDPRANRLQMLASLLNVPLLWLIAGSQQVPDPTAGITKEEMILQKIADLDSIIDLLKSDLDELRVLAEAGD